jgi:hypothetical protein
MNGGKNRTYSISFENVQKFKCLGTAAKIKVVFIHTRIAD